MLFSIVVVLIYNPTSTAGGFPFLHVLFGFVICRFTSFSSSSSIFFFFSVLTACGSSQTRDRIHATAVTGAVAVTTLDSQPLFAGVFLGLHTLLN